ncbi:MAG TPA: hypothetical protein VGS80_11655 [Ktedonobacterales bacterium]|nr:hypothetical protein [Ktedonobacterales bacterium]
MEADPAVEDAALTLEEPRPCGRRANQYRESVVWADVAVGDADT